jgi:hypothetical protein
MVWIPYSRCHKEIMFMSADCRLDSLLHHDLFFVRGKIGQEQSLVE